MISGIPAAFMCIMTIWALILNQTKFGTAHNMLLQIINGVILIVAIWIAVEGFIKLFSNGESAEGATPQET